MGEGVGGTHTKGTGAAAAAAAATAGGGDGGGGEALQYLFGAAQEWWQQAEAAKGQLSAVGSTVRLLLLQHGGGGGSTLENVLPNYGMTMTAHDNVASKYPTETMVKAACTPDFTIPKPPNRSDTGSSGSQHSP